MVFCKKMPFQYKKYPSFPMENLFTVQNDFALKRMAFILSFYFYNRQENHNKKIKRDRPD